MPDPKNKSSSVWCSVHDFAAQPIETAPVMAYGSQTEVACYTDRNGQIRFLYGSA